MITAAEIAGMRDTASAALPDVGTIVRPAPTGAGSLDPATGIWTPTAPTTIYTGALRIRPPSAAEVEVLFGEQQVTLTRYVGTGPWDMPDIAIDDIVTLTVSSDSQLVGLPLRVTAPLASSWLICRRFAAETVE